MQKAKELLSNRHQVVTTALTRRSNERTASIAHIVSLDNQIVHLTNEQADLATAMCRLDGVNNTFMPTTQMWAETSDAYVPNPFPDAEDGPITEADGFLLEAADQIGGMKHIDGNMAICAFTRDGLLNLLRTASKKAKPVLLDGHTVAFSGAFTSIEREDAKHMAERAGAKVVGSVSTKVTLLVVGPGAGSKLDKANALGIRVISEQQFLAAVAEAVQRSERKTYDQLADELQAASDRYHGSEIQHVKSGGRYRIVGVHHRESDMAVCVEYTPIGSTFHNRVKFARSIEEMAFGTRFTFVGGALK
ncbi:BRCT domain-containing protein [Aquamicrobium zhengzhouense]|nr:BRCT domain-containing protein [Aquamicrobium zhengzhouense]